MHVDVSRVEICRTMLQPTGIISISWIWAIIISLPLRRVSLLHSNILFLYILYVVLHQKFEHQYSLSWHYTTGNITRFDLSPGLSFLCVIITLSDLSKHSQPSCSTGKPLTSLFREKKVYLKDETSLNTMLFEVVSQAGYLKPRLALATLPLVLMCNHHSPLQMSHYSLSADTILRPIWGCAPQACSLRGK